MKGERVVALPNGQVHRHNSKKKRHRKSGSKIKKFKPSEQPKTNSHKYSDVASTKGMNPIMSNSQKDVTISFRQCELIYDSVKLPYDGRCHPHFKD
jgi:hypothetical protein